MSIWELAYIDDAATKHVPIYRLNGKLLTDLASNYDTPSNGVHLCGQTDDGQQPTTVARYPMPAAKARTLFELARSVAECADGEDDFIVDLCINDFTDDDFYSNRQLWPRAIAAWNEW